MRNFIAVVAGALALASAKPLNTRVEAVTPALFANFQFYAQYAAAAYCVSNDQGTNGGLITCTEGACPRVETAGAFSVVEFDNDNSDVYGEQGFLAVDPTNEILVMSFRGSDSIANYIVDLTFDLVDTTLCTGCEVHDGFNTAWTEAEPILVAALTKARAKYPSYPLIVTGHSLGAAVATIAVASLRAQGFPCDLYAFGSPRVGNAAFAKFVTAQSGGNYRITHFDDPVPRLPPLLLEYRHLSPEYWLSDGSATTIDYAITDVKVCDGIASTDCNARYSNLDVTAHSYYFEKIGACSPPLSITKKDIRSTNTATLRYAAFAEGDIKYAASVKSAGLEM